MKRNTGKTIKKIKVNQTNRLLTSTPRDLFIPFIGQEEVRASMLCETILCLCFLSFVRLLTFTTNRDLPFILDKQIVASCFVRLPSSSGR